MLNMNTVYNLIKKKNNNFKKLIVLNPVLLVILIIAAILRFWGVNPGYPYFHSDEGMSYHNAIQFITQNRLAPDVYAYPLLVVIIHIISYVFIFIPITFIGSFFSDLTIFDYSSIKMFFENEIIGYNEINVLYWGRYTNAFLGVISVYITYLLGKNYFNKNVGIIAALMVSVNYRHVLASHFALHDIANNIFLSLVYLQSLVILKSNSIKDYIKGGVYSGLSFSVKYSPLGLIPLILAHSYKANFRKINKIFFVKLFVLILFCLITILAINFYYIFNINEVVKYLDYLKEKYNAGTLQFLFFPYVYIYWFSLTPPIAFLTILGIMLYSMKEFKKASILLIPIIIFFLSLTVFSSGGLYVRNFTLVTPVLLIFASYAIYYLYERFFGNKILSRILVILLITLSLTPHLINSVILDYHYAKNWNLTEAKFDLSRVRDVKVAGDNWFWDQIFENNKNLTKIDFNINTNFTFRELQEAGADYALIDTGSTERYFTWWMPISNTSKFINPKDLMYETLPGSVIRELISRREREYSKPWQAYESNIFWIPIPQIPDNFEGKLVYEDNFEDGDGWRVRGARGTQVRFLKKIVDEGNCIEKNCVWIGPITSASNQYRIWGTVSYESPVIEVDEDYLYKINLMIKSDKKTEGVIQDGFFKVELFRNEDDLKNHIEDSVIFVSSRYSNKDAHWQEKEVFAEIPKGYKYLVVRLQSFNNNHNSFYFDNLRIEKSIKKWENPVQRKTFPEDIIFINSII